MEQMTKDLDRICDAKKTVLRKVEQAVDRLDPETSTIQDVQGMDMLVNMLHHFVEAEKCAVEAEKCKWEKCYYQEVVKAMRDGGEDPEWDDESFEHADDTPNRNRTSSGRFRRGNTTGRRFGMRRYPGGDGDPDWDGTMQHGDLMGPSMTMDMSPDQQLEHLKHDVEAMWKNAGTDQRKKIKESLSKWSTSLTV